jgi:LysM repeat protein
MNFKINFAKLKARKGSKKLRATAARRPMRASVAPYDEMAEPNMKLSRALLIVLILHVVAVSGVIAFNAIKTRQDAGKSTGMSSPAPRESSSPAKVATAPVAGSPAPAGSNIQPEIRRARPVAKPSDDSHKLYTVQKGENPVAIAKKLKVPYDDLAALNHIDDPHKLKVGQKLLVPNKLTKAKKTAE